MTRFGWASLAFWLAIISLVVSVAASRNFCTGWWNAETKICRSIGAR